MGTTSSSAVKDEGGTFYSPMCCMRSRAHTEEPISHLSWQRSSLRTSHQGKPGPPEGIVQLDKVTHNFVVLSWLPPLDRGLGQILAYHVERFSYKDKKWQTVTESCQGNSYKVRDLVSGTKYIFRVRAENMIGVGRPSVESDSVVLPAFESVDGVDLNIKDGTTTFTRRGSNFLDRDSGVKTIVSRSLDASDNLARWSFPRQQSRRRTTLDSIIKRPYSTGNRSSFSTGFRESKRLLKNNPLFVDDMEASKAEDKQKSLTEDETTKLVKTSHTSPVVENNLDSKESTVISACSDEELETAMIVSKGFVPALEMLSRHNSAPQFLSEKKSDTMEGLTDVRAQFKCRRITMSDSKLQPKPEDEMLEYDLDETGAKVSIKRRSTSSTDRVNIRKPLHAKLFTPLGEDSLDEYEGLELTEKESSENSRKVSPSEDELSTDDIHEVVKSLTSLYHSQVSLCDKADIGQDQEAVSTTRNIVEQTPTLTRVPLDKVDSKKMKAAEEPLTSEYDGSASDSDEGRSTIPKVIPVFIETDTSRDDDPTDTSASSHNDQPSTDTEVEELESDSDLSLTDYFGDESDDSADIDSLSEIIVKKSSKVKIPDTSDEEEPKVQQSHTVDVQVHATTTTTPVTKRRHKHVKPDKTLSESDSAACEGIKERKHRSPRSVKASVEETKSSDSLTDSVVETPEIVVDEIVKKLSLPESDSQTDSLGKNSSVKRDSLEFNYLDKNTEALKTNVIDACIQREKTLKNKDVDIGDAEDQRAVTPTGSDEGVDMETMSDTEVVIIHSTEVITRLQELMAKDQKLSDILLSHPQFKHIVKAPVVKQKVNRESRSKVTFADMKQNKL